MPWSQNYIDSIGPYMQWRDNFDGVVRLNCDSTPKDIINAVFGITNNTKKETNKMEAKKCDRCGKLYEMPGAGETDGVDIRFKHMRISGAEDMSGNKIVEKQTKRIYIGRYHEGDVDLCNECRKSLKKWFESADKEDNKV